MPLASQRHHDLQDVGGTQKRFATRRASSDPIEHSPEDIGLHLFRRALSGVLQCVEMISTHKAARIAVLVTVETLTVSDHVKFHVRHRWRAAPDSVVEEPDLALWGEVMQTDHVVNNSRATQH